MSSPNADLIAVSLACPKDPTSPYRMHMGPPTESSVRNLLEKVGNLRDIAVLVQLNVEFHVANENWPSPMFMSI